MRKTIPFIFFALLFAGMAIAGEVQIMNHQVEVLSSDDDFSHCQWTATVRNATLSPKKVEMKIDFCDKNGYTLHTVKQSIYLQEKQKHDFYGHACLNCKSDRIASSHAEIISVRNLGK